MNRLGCRRMFRMLLYAVCFYPLHTETRGPTHTHPEKKLIPTYLCVLSIVHKCGECALVHHATICTKHARTHNKSKPAREKERERESEMCTFMLVMRVRHARETSST